MSGLHVCVFLACPNESRGGKAFAAHYLSKATDSVLQYTVPISLHGDGTPVSGIGKAWSKSVDIWSWTSLVARGGSNHFHRQRKAT